MGFTNNPKVKGQRLQSKSFVLSILVKEVYPTISENIKVDEFSLAEKHLFEVEHVNTSFFSASVITKNSQF